MNKLRFGSNTNIRDIEAKVMMKLRDALDTAPESQNWRAFIAHLRHPYIFKPIEIEKMAMKMHSNGSPSSQLILELGARGMDVGELVRYLDELRVEKILMDFRNYESVEITSEPSLEKKLFVGETLVLSVEATGFPYPRYQWFFDSSEIIGALENTLTISDIRIDQTGYYCCRLHNCADPNKTKFTNHSLVKVYPDTPHSKPQHVLTKIPSDDQNDSVDEYSKGDLTCNLPVIVVQPRDVFIRKGSQFHVECRANSCFPLNYVWYQNGQYFSHTEVPELVVDRSMSSHSGKYHCIVKNNYGEAHSNPFVVTVSEHNMPQLIKEPEIIGQPKSCSVQLGGVAVFVVEACGSLPMSYQWYKDSTLIRGQEFSELRIPNIQSCEIQGVYICAVTNQYGGKFSDGALLTISSELPVSQQYFATDKFALLIGNYSYKAENSLKAPKQDIKTLTLIFRSLGFKVVSLLNLTKTEMISAVVEFSDLIDDGVYSVFYFCGHGFEENGQCYLVPEDAPTGFTWEDCLCADQVLERIQNRNPTICCMILDICRRKNRVVSNEVPNIVKTHPIRAGNTIICYATSSGLSAFEHPQSGILVSFLQRHLCKPISIESVFQHLRTDITENERCQGKQIPEVLTNLIQPARSLTDKIWYHGGGTQAFCHRQILWEAAHKRPASRVIEVRPNDLGIVLELDFQSEFSNVLHIYVTVKQKKNISECIAWVAQIPNTLSIMDEPCSVTNEDCPFKKTKNVIQDIQKLKGDMEVTIAVKYTLEGSGQKQITHSDPVNLELPLIGALHLWKPRNLALSAQPVEQTEDASL